MTDETEVKTKPVMTVFMKGGGKETINLAPESQPRPTEGVLMFMDSSGVMSGIPLANLVRFTFKLEAVH